MVTDAMLAEAAAEAEQFLLWTASEPEQPHIFSDRFERKMRKVTCRANYYVLYQVMRTAAIVVLVIASLFGTVMAVSPEVRAAVIESAEKVVPRWIEYKLAPKVDSAPATGETEPSRPSVAWGTYEYRLTYIPEGFREKSIYTGSSAKDYVYINDKNNVYMVFGYYSDKSSSSLYLGVGDSIHYTGTVNGVQADIYVTGRENDTGAIVWRDPETNWLFAITALGDKEELIKIAESVEKIKK